MVKHIIISTLSINGRRGFLTSPDQCVDLIQSFTIVGVKELYILSLQNIVIHLSDEYAIRQTF